jgi:predicted site-specific integrase-resolvase
MNTSETNQRRAVLYLRVASADQRDQREGMPQQRVACNREAERLDAVIAAELVDVAGSAR